MDDLLEALLKGGARAFGYFLSEIVFELLLKAPGCHIVKRLRGGEPDHDSLSVILAGAAFWIAVVATSYGLWQLMETPAPIDG